MWIHNICIYSNAQFVFYSRTARGVFLLAASTLNEYIKRPSCLWVAVSMRPPHTCSFIYIALCYIEEEKKTRFHVVHASTMLLCWLCLLLLLLASFFPSFFGESESIERRARSRLCAPAKSHSNHRSNLPDAHHHIINSREHRDMLRQCVSRFYIPTAKINAIFGYDSW